MENYTRQYQDIHQLMHQGWTYIPVYIHNKNFLQYSYNFPIKHDKHHRPKGDLKIVAMILAGRIIKKNSKRTSHSFISSH